MGAKRLTLGFTLSTLFVCLSVPALELDKSQPELALVEQGCAYGRGALAVATAKADGLNKLRLFLQGETSYSLSTNDTELFNEQFSQQTRDLLISGIAQGQIHAHYDQVEIIGDDTCITVRIASPKAEKSLNNNGVTWNSEPTVSVVVVGEGKSRSGLSARQVAEQDAFQRAVSQVLGVMVKSGFMQQTNSVMSASADSDEFNLQEVAKQSLSLQSQGVVSRWNEIATQELEDGTLKLTLDITVEKKLIADKVEHLIQSLGQPSVFVDAQLPVVQANFKDTLASMGFGLSPSSAQASIILKITEQEKLTPSGLQLELSARVLDRAGNQYGVWQNDPRLITLPNKKGMLTELATVHLAVDQNRQNLKEQLHDSMQKMAMRGGPIRELILSEHVAGKQGQLYSLLSAITGVSDVKISSKSGKVFVQLRSLNNANDLAQYIEPTLKMHQPQYKSKLIVLNEYQIQAL